MKSYFVCRSYQDVDIKFSTHGSFHQVCPMSKDWKPSHFHILCGSFSLVSYLIISCFTGLVSSIRIILLMFLLYIWNGNKYLQTLIRLKDRPFNLKGGGGRGYVFLFRSKICVRTTQELEYHFFVGRSTNFFPEFNIRLYDKNSESHYFFFPPPKSEYFFQQHWESVYFFKKKNITPPPSLSS